MFNTSFESYDRLTRSHAKSVPHYQLPDDESDPRQMSTDVLTQRAEEFARELNRRRGGGNAADLDQAAEVLKAKEASRLCYAFREYCRHVETQVQLVRRHTSRDAD